MSFGSISIDSGTGEVTLARPVQEVKGQTLEYVLLATDGANATATTVLTVNVLDSQEQGPSFSDDLYTASVDELETDLLPSITVYVRPPHTARFNSLFTFCVSRRRRKMYCGHARLCVCLSVCPRPYAHTTALPGCNLGAW